MDNILLTVIVPIYNTCNYLSKCIDSIINQTYSNIEIILVDDGSTDDSLKICREYQRRDARVSVISQPNQGLITARKNGVLKAKGTLIGFVDSDDWIEPDMYEQMIAIYKDTNAGLVSTGVFRDFENSTKSVEILDNYDEGLYSNLDRDIYPTMLRNDKKKDYGLYCTLWNKLFRKDRLLKVYETINTQIFYGEDCLTIYPYCLLVDSIYISRKSYYHYNIRGNSMCRSADERLPHNTYLLYNELKQTFMNYSNPYILMRQLRKYILNVEIHSLQVLYDIDVNVYKKWNYPFKFLDDSKFIIYGAGVCGKTLYHQFCLKHKEDNIVAWIDKDYKNKSAECLYKIDPPKKLLDLQYDHIIIAVFDIEHANQIKEELMNMWNICERKIIWRQMELCELEE